MVYELNAKTRETFGRKLTESRQAGLIPAVIYGPEVKGGVSIFLDERVFNKLVAQGSGNAVINLKVEGEKEPREVLIKEISRDVVKDTIAHVDFYQFQRGHKLEIEVALNFFGQAPVVKELNGILVKSMDKIKVRCFPKDIISEIKVDLSVLKTLENKILIKDLAIPETLEVLADRTLPVVAVSVAQEEKIEVVKPTAEAVAAAEVAEKAAPGAATPEKVGDKAAKPEKSDKKADKKS